MGLRLRGADLGRPGRPARTAGAAHFAATIRAVRTLDPAPGVEVLTPDFQGRFDSLARRRRRRGPTSSTTTSRPCRASTADVRRGARLDRSLGAARRRRRILDSGADDEVGLHARPRRARRARSWSCSRRLREAGVDIVTIGQYLRPSRENLPVVEYVRSGGLRALPREGRAPRLSPRLRGPLRAVVLPRGGGARGRRRSGARRRAEGRGLAARWHDARGGVVSGLLFALAFPPFEVGAAAPPRAGALARARSRARRAGRRRAPLRRRSSASRTGALSIPWIFYVVTHYGGQSGVMGVVCLVAPGRSSSREWPVASSRGARSPSRRRGSARRGSRPSRSSGWPPSTLRTVVYRGFPWNLTAHALYRHPIWLQTGVGLGRLRRRRPGRRRPRRCSPAPP